MKILRKLLFPLIWFKQLQGNITTSLTNKLASKTGANKSNRFKEWKLKQPVWKQVLIEIPVYLLVIWILNLLFNELGYGITLW